MISVDAEGAYYASVGDNQDQSIGAQELVARVSAVLRRNPQTPVMVKGDSSASYGQVVGAMALLQKAGVPNVGLITQRPETETQ